jgi:hypothetical protein
MSEHQMLGVLNDRERHIFEARRLADEPITLKELADELGISRERVRKIEKHAFEKVQKARLREAAGAELKKPNAPIAEVLDTPIAALGFSVRAMNCLQHYQRYDTEEPIRCLGDLVSKTEWNLLVQPNLGRWTLAEIKNVLASMGLHLAGEALRLESVGGQCVFCLQGRNNLEKDGRIVAQVGNVVFCDTCIEKAAASIARAKLRAV